MSRNWADGGEMVRAFLARGNNICKDRKIEEIGITEY